jgi:hypothetical protein
MCWQPLFQKSSQFALSGIRTTTSATAPSTAPSARLHGRVHRDRHIRRNPAPLCWPPVPFWGPLHPENYSSSHDSFLDFHGDVHAASGSGTRDVPPTGPSASGSPCCKQFVMKSAPYIHRLFPPGVCCAVARSSQGGRLEAQAPSAHPAPGASSTAYAIRSFLRC